MKNIATCSVLIQDVKGSVLFIINRNKIEFDDKVKIISEHYYRIGGILIINEDMRTIDDIQFIYRENHADFQTVITVK